MTTGSADFIWKDLLAAVYWFDESLQKYFESAGLPQMSRTKSLIMLSIAEGAQRPIQIAENLGLTRQGVHLAVKELERDGFISVEDDPEDGRAKRIFFAAGDQQDHLRREAREALLRIEQALAARVGRQNFEVFRAVLRADWGEPVSPEE